MGFADDRVLEILATDGPASPKQVSEDKCVPFGRNHANRRMRMLSEAGLLRLVGNGIYQITELGENYLEGKDMRDIEEPDIGW